MIAGFLRGLSDVFFPPACVHCGGLVEDSPYRHLCAECAAGIEWAPAGSGGAAAVLHRGPARALMIELKYRRGLYVLEDMEAIFRSRPDLLAWAGGAVLVPVPLHPRKERERGFNQSLLLAARLARAAGGGARVGRLLRRTADTPSQTALHRGERRRNLKNAFALAPRAGLDCRDRYLIVDDVSTTGSTLDACIRVLAQAGCLNLGGVTFAQG